MQGKVLRYNRARGFGFIEPLEGDQDLFFHISALPESDRCLKNIEGRAVTFELGEYRGRPQAMQVRLLPIPKGGGAPASDKGASDATN